LVPSRYVLEIRGEKENLEIVSVHLPKEYLKYLEMLVKMGLYPSRSEAIRVAIRDLIHKEIDLLHKSMRVIA